jgi:hypothetical protein
MVAQYPHILVIELPTSHPVQVNGEWVFSGVTSTEFVCRAEPNSGNKTILSQSGEMVVFEFTVYLPKMDIEIPFGVDCTLKISGTREIKAKVKRHENGQLNSRIWL